MENAEWMSAEVRQEVDELRQKHGLEGSEAVAFWHLMKAQSIMLDFASYEMHETVSRARRDAEGGSGEMFLAVLLPNVAFSAAGIQTRIRQPFEALFGLLGKRVLGRHFPDGWGKVHRDADEED